MMDKNIVPHEHKVRREDRSRLKLHAPGVLWFTGLSGSGKSTLANLVELELNRNGVHTFLLDGDNIRSDLNRDLGFSLDDRSENIRRIGEVAKLFFDAGLIVITAFISPIRHDRDLVRKKLPESAFVEIFLDCPLDICEQRDPKGLYRKARAGEVAEFTGIGSPYEPPLSPEITIHTGTTSPLDGVAQILRYLKDQQFWPGKV